MTPRRAATFIDPMLLFRTDSLPDDPMAERLYNRALGRAEQDAERTTTGIVGSTHSQTRTAATLSLCQQLPNPRHLDSLRRIRRRRPTTA